MPLIDFRLKLRAYLLESCIRQQSFLVIAFRLGELLFKFRYIRQSLVHIQIYCCLNLFRFRHILKENLFFAKQSFEDIRNLELSSCCRPFSETIPILVSGNINSVIHQTHSVVCSLMLKCVAVSLAEIHNKLDNLRRRIRNLDGVGLDVGNRVSTFLYLMLQIHHEQSPTLSHDIVNVSRITERILERCRSQTINRIDRGLQSISKLLRCHLTIDHLLNIRCKLAIQHLVHNLPSFMLDADTTLDNVTERCCKLHAEQNFCNRTMRVHRSNIQQCIISVHTRLRIYITAFSDFLSTIYRLSVLESIPRKIWQKASCLTVRLMHHFRTSFCQEIISFSINVVYRLCKIPIVELILRFPLISKYNSGCERVGCVIYRHICQVCQNLSCRPIRLQINKGCFCCNNIVITILSNLGPKFFGNRFIPRKPQLLVMRPCLYNTDFLF